MIAFYATSFRTLHRWAWRARHWAHDHPVWARTLVVLLLVVVLTARSQAAHAAGFLPDQLDYKDTYGNRFTQYAKVDIDAGDAIHPDKVIVNFFVQMIWVLQYFTVGMFIWLLGFLLSFQWVEWLSTPFNALALWLQDLLGEIQWIPFALMIAALAGGIAIFIGRVAGGLWEMLVAAVIAVLAVGPLANPIATLTAADGVLDKAQQFGGELASSIAVEEDMIGETSETMSAAVVSQFMDVFVRIPYQVVSYLTVLPEKCQPFFSNYMASGNDYVHSALMQCMSQESREASENPGAMNLLNVIVNGLGIGTLNLFGTLIAILLIVAVFFFLIAAIKSMIFVYLAIAPINREPLWRSISDAFLGAISLVVMTVCLSLYLKLTVWILSETGFLPHLVRMWMITLIMIVIIYLVWRARRATMRSGRSAAGALSKLGLGMRPGPRDSNALLKMGAVTQMAKSGYDMVRRSPKMTTSAPASQGSGAGKSVSPGAPSSPPASLAPGSGAPQALPSGKPVEFVASAPDSGSARDPRQGSSGGPLGSGATEKPAIGQRVASAGSAVATVATGAVRGGPLGAVSAAGGLAMQGIKNKAASARHRSEDLGELKVVTVNEGPESRFQVNRDGTASIRRDQQVHDVSSLPSRPASETSARALERRQQLEAYRSREPVSV